MVQFMNYVRSLNLRSHAPPHHACSALSAIFLRSPMAHTSGSTRKLLSAFSKMPTIALIHRKLNAYLKMRVRSIGEGISLRNFIQNGPLLDVMRYNVPGLVYFWILPICVLSEGLLPT